MHTKFQSENPEERDNFEDFGRDHHHQHNNPWWALAFFFGMDGILNYIF